MEPLHGHGLAPCGLAMRKNAPFTTYNRVIAMNRLPPRHPDADSAVMIPTTGDLARSVLGMAAMGEYRFISSWVEWAQADGTTYA